MTAVFEVIMYVRYQLCGGCLVNFLPFLKKSRYGFVSPFNCWYLYLLGVVRKNEQNYPSVYSKIGILPNNVNGCEDSHIHNFTYTEIKFCLRLNFYYSLIDFWY